MLIIRIRAPHISALLLIILIALNGIYAVAQSNLHPTADNKVADYSGMYTFLQDGEFVQITVEGKGQVTGFVSRYGDSESDRGVFLDHFFKSGKLDDNQLTFTTDTVHGVAFEFHGTVERGAGKSRADEAYYVIKGTLIESISDQTKKVSSQRREVSLESFPADLSAPAAKN